MARCGCTEFLHPFPLPSKQKETRYIRAGSLRESCDLDPPSPGDFPPPGQIITSSKWRRRKNHPHPQKTGESYSAFSTHTHTHTVFLLHDKKPSLVSHTLLLPPPPPSKKKSLILYIVRFADKNARCLPPAAGPGRRSSEQRRCYHSPALLCNLQNRENGVLSLYLRSATP